MAYHLPLPGQAGLPQAYYTLYFTWYQLMYKKIKATYTSTPAPSTPYYLLPYLLKAYKTGLIRTLSSITCYLLETAIDRLAKLCCKNKKGRKKKPRRRNKKKGSFTGITLLRNTGYSHKFFWLLARRLSSSQIIAMKMHCHSIYTGCKWISNGHYQSIVLFIV